MIGPNAAVARTGGGGSSRVTPKSSPPAPLDGIKERAGSQFQVGYALGCSMEGEDKAKETATARAGLIQEAVALAQKSDVAVDLRGLLAGHRTGNV